MLGVGGDVSLLLGLLGFPPVILLPLGSLNVNEENNQTELRDCAG